MIYLFQKIEMPEHYCFIENCTGQKIHNLGFLKIKLGEKSFLKFLKLPIIVKAADCVKESFPLK